MKKQSQDNGEYKLRYTLPAPIVALVYELYGLTEAEIAIVESGTK